jgi:hypothetical protein
MPEFALRWRAQGMIPPIAALLSLLWVLLTSVLLVRRGERAAVAVPATA